MSIKIEEGKFYRTQSGKKLGPAHPIHGSDFTWNVPTEYGGFMAYDDYGNFCLNNRDWDLKEEWIANPTLPTRWGRMTSEEKGALLLARHEGEVIEYYDLCGTWRTYGGGIERLFYDSDAYRIKPEPKRETVTLYCDGGNFGKDPMTIGTIDLIDGEPDPATIKMEEL